MADAAPKVDHASKEDKDSPNTEVPSPNWVVLVSILIVATALSAAIALLIGYRHGKAERNEDFAQATDEATNANRRLREVEAELVSKNRHVTRLEATARERDTQLAEARLAVQQAKAFAKAAEDKAGNEMAAAEATAKKRRDEETRLAEAKNKEELLAKSKKKQQQRANPVKTSFKDFVNFPEEYVGQCIKFENVWLHGGFDRIENTRLFSPSVSSEDGKAVYGKSAISEFTGGIVFVMAEDLGRPLDLLIESDMKYGSHLCCEVTKSEKADKLYVARIYRIELLKVSGGVKQTFEEK